MSGNGFGRYLTDEYRAKGRNAQADDRRAGERTARENLRDRRADVVEAAGSVRADRRAGMAGKAAQEAAKDEIERCGRGFGRYLV